MLGENQCQEKAVTWWAWKIAKAAKRSSRANSTQDMTICTVTVTVTPPATAATINKKKTAPTRVTTGLLDASEFEKRPSRVEPTGMVAMTMKIRADTMSAHPERNPRKGWSARRTHE